MSTPVKCRLGGNGPPYILADAHGRTYAIEHFDHGRGPSGVHRVYRCTLSGTPEALVVSRIDPKPVFVDWSGKRCGTILTEGPRDPEFLVVYRLDLEPGEQIPPALVVRQQLWELLDDHDGEVPPDAVDELVAWVSKLQGLRSGTVQAPQAAEAKGWTGVDPHRLQDAFEEALLAALAAAPRPLSELVRLALPGATVESGDAVGTVTRVREDGGLEVTVNTEPTISIGFTADEGPPADRTVRFTTEGTR